MASVTYGKSIMSSVIMAKILWQMKLSPQSPGTVKSMVSMGLWGLDGWCSPLPSLWKENKISTPLDKFLCTPLDKLLLASDWRKEKKWTLILFLQEIGTFVFWISGLISIISRPSNLGIYYWSSKFKGHALDIEINHLGLRILHTKFRSIEEQNQNTILAPLY